MKINDFQNSSDFSNQIKRIILSRVIFTVIMIISCLVVSLGENLSFFSQPFFSLYNIAACILALSIVYLVWLNKFKKNLALAYFQTITDTIIVTAIIFVTGSYDSIFTFFYLVVIIYTSMLLFQKGSLIIATISCFQYSILIELEYYQIIPPFSGSYFLSNTVNDSHIIYRIIIVIVACYAVAILSGILALQLKGAKQDLKIVQEHLKRVEKMAAMDEMISGIAHEIKNPLASLSGSIQLLQEDTKPGSYEDKLMQIILRETHRLENIVNDIRLFAKPHTDNAIDIKLADAIEETVELFSNDPEWNQKIRVTAKMNKKLSVFIDPSHFAQILWNLLKNAAQSIKGHGEIKILLKPSLNNRVHLSIKDSGTGIHPKDYTHIFDPFYTSKPDGTGLGLSIIHRLIDTYNGVIHFESTPGKGTVFTVLFKGVPLKTK
ncbi:MAG: two-component sensor histidine kinase [Desulfobacula sp.]|jgi:two-component system, NtrC family, sensor histidine kinase HydH|uniref:two-component system sensor histidine kinase NtrB n=1 Tax=Desulfobacula sp. TaxID=2593537 RepID=UPI001DEB381C|nr:two-component sensor histidine kinase [Desulfobacula sp.]MBT3484434.1 two-component sensor histidine kinase [Desulfobacula sp.]MBT3803349.1 two-component sensor histidine kinase [Desulfobacula sp.]MBT4023684.1 two-component sensor histidine kinase [Desulfobacula sp.]MBT4197926.1 two-component sensor histidine kinase [Desulfobacula sp.]